MTSPLDKSLFEERLLKMLKTELDSLADGLDMPTQSRLNQIRQRALSKPHRLSSFYTLWGTGVLAISVLLGAMTLNLYPSYLSTSNHPTAQLSELPVLDKATLEILMSDEELELLEELELYAWLAAEYG